ncbi:MAG: M14 family zinc carboxypeptidase [Pseudomonadota bacterium]
MRRPRLAPPAVLVALLSLGAGLAPSPAPEDTGGRPEGYPTVEEVEQALTRIAALAPERAHLRDLTAELDLDPTWEGRHLWAVEIGAGAGRPRQVVVAGQHPREVVPPLAALALAERLAVAAVDDPAALAVVEGFDTLILPLANPDGWAFVLEEDAMWRKNRRVFDDSVGVDLNRNFPFGWDADCAGSTDPQDRKYKGPQAASEAETRTLMAALLALHPARLLDLHAWGAAVKVGYACHEHPLAGWLRARAGLLAADLGDGVEVVPPSAEGELAGWALHDLGTLAMVVEMGEEFQPPIEEAQALAAQVAEDLLPELARAPPLSGQVVDAVTGAPLAADLRVVELAFSGGERPAGAADDGRFDLWLPPGAWNLHIAAPGYAATRVEVLVADVAAMERRIALEPLARRGEAGCASSGARAGLLVGGLALLAALARRRQGSETGIAR